jgi:hypothetical protein
VESSGEWSAFKEGVVIPGAKPHIPKPSNLIYHICPILSNLISHCKVWALYMQNLGLSSPDMHDFAHKKIPKSREIYSNFVIKIYKGLLFI